MKLSAAVLLLTMAIVNQAIAAEVAPTALTFKTIQGGSNPADQTIIVSKGGTRPSTWRASDNAAWLSVTPTSGTITSSAQIGVSVNSAGLTPGIYSASVQVAIRKGGTVLLPITLTVEPPSPPATKSITLGWDPNSEPDVAGYKLYLGKASGSYGSPINVGKTTSYTLSNLAAGSTYYFTVTAYNVNGAESVYSNEVSTSIY